MYEFIKKQDTEVFSALDGEEKREREGLELIPSENYVSKAVREAQGSILTNKYAEGYPGKRYYGGQQFTDAAEILTIERAKQLFGAKFANVQPHAGAPANIGTYFALMEPGDTIMGMDLSHGGHLTHGHPVTYITKIFNFVRYKMKNVETGEIDYDEMLAVAKKEKPKVLMAGFSAYSRELNYQKFVDIGREVGALVIADVAHIAGLIAGKAAKNPFDFGFDVMLTTTHKTLRGPRGGLILMGKDFENPFGAVAPKSGRTKMMSELLDSMVIPGIQGGPLMHVIAAKAKGFNENLQPDFRKYSEQIIKNAQALAGAMVKQGYQVISGGTDNHLMLIDLRNKNITGKDAQEALDKSGITVNKNAVPFDDKSPLITSGIRIGTPAITTRGMKEPDMETIARMIDDVIAHPTDTSLFAKISDRVKDLCTRFPLYPELAA